MLNNDPVGCAPRAFTFSADVPRQRRGQLGDRLRTGQTAPIAPQATGTTTFSVTPNSSASGSKAIASTPAVARPTLRRRSWLAADPDALRKPDDDLWPAQRRTDVDDHTVQQRPGRLRTTLVRFHRQRARHGAANWVNSFSTTPITVAAQASGTTTFRVTPNSSASGSKAITISAGGGTTTVTATVVACSQAPSLSANPTLRIGPTGAAMTYTITVQNNDPAGCAPRNFTMSANVPNPGSANWATSFSPNPVNGVAAQGTATTTLTVTPNGSATGSKDITVTTNSGGSVVVTATIGNCNNLPTVTVLAPNPQSGFAGETRTYNVRVTNNNPAGCADKQYLFNTQMNPISAQWAVSTPNPITLASGAQGTRTVDVTPNSNVNAGSYTWQVTAGSVTATGTYNVSPATPPPPTPTPTPTPPTANFTCTPLSVAVNTDVTCTDTSTGPVTSWSWDFGDGTALNTNQNPTHQYAAPGTYDVKLTVNGPNGSDSRTRAAYVTVN